MANCNSLHNSGASVSNNGTFSPSAAFTLAFSGTHLTCYGPALRDVMIQDVQEKLPRNGSSTMDIPNAFIGKTQQPAPAEIAAALGSAAPIWSDLVAWFATELGVPDQEWKSTSQKYGWTLVLSLKKRRIVYLAPCAGCFRAALILGDRAVVAARNAGLPKPVLKLLDEAPHYAEGTGLRLMVRTAKDVPPVKKFAQIKLAN